MRAGPNADDYKKAAQDNGKKQDKVRAEAKDKETERDALIKESAARMRGGTTGSRVRRRSSEIGIAISTVAIITKRRMAWYGALGLGAVGLALLGWAYLTWRGGRHLSRRRERRARRCGVALPGVAGRDLALDARRRPLW